MKREIKFRGKVKHHNPMTNPENGWVEGYYFQDLAQGEMRNYIFLPPRYWEVIPETVGQFTGLLDKNGKEVWEHDIVDWDGVKLLVEFIDGIFCMHENYKDETLHDILLKRDEINVIGNRFDNPELLKTRRTMKREEEIFQRAKEVGEFIVNTSPSTYNAALRGFCRGVEFADKTMLDRACEWLESRVSEYFPVDTDECGTPFCESWIKAQEERIKAMKEFITAFRQAMEGGTE